MYLFSENGQNVVNVKAIWKSTPLYVKERKKRVAPSLHGPTSHWLHANSIPNIGCHYFWPGLIALRKNTPPIMMSNYGVFIGPCPHRGRDYHIGSNFWKFYLIKTNFTLSELVSLVKVFRLFRLERIFLMLRVWTE
jgi:hypothetical protein